MALLDGTVLTLTSNHPVLASGQAEHKGTDVFSMHMPAAELQRGVHHLSVLKIVDLPVGSVTPPCNAGASLPTHGQLLLSAFQDGKCARWGRAAEPLPSHPCVRSTL